MPIVWRLDLMLTYRKMKVNDLAEKIKMAPANVSALKNNAKAIRFETLSRICDALDCNPGDLMWREPGKTSEEDMDD